MSPRDSVADLTAAVQKQTAVLVAALQAVGPDAGAAVADALNGVARRASYGGAYSVR